ncbi:MFS transporter [Paraburkholderia sp. J63]|uniref:MFS transporter n=1 Tax=Paraburkholderia sp. J63 TaxID=2805434 RepID=UPI002ABDA4C9|nr:MFS transporter [Paraburkholderia sp. J63]
MPADPLALRRWSIVFASACALAVGNAPIAIFTFGIFSKAVVAEFGWSRGAVGAALGALNICGAFAIPFFGACIDRFGVRRPMLASIVLSCLALAAVSLAHSFWAFVLAFALFGVFCGGITPVPHAKLIAAWFGSRRGLALGLAMSGTGVGAALVPLLAHELLTHYGWRAGYQGLALLAAVIGLVATASVLRDPPAVATPQRERRPLTPAPWRTILARTEFWLMALAVFAVCTALTGMIVTAVPLLTDRGMPALIATSVVSSAGLASAGGRLLTGALLDVFFGPRVAACAFVASALGIALMAVGGPTWVYLVASVLIGGALGAEVDVIGYLVSRYFDIDTFGRAYGLVFFAFSVASGSGGYLLGLCHDLTGSYTSGVWACAALCLLGALLISRLGPYRVGRVRDANEQGGVAARPA